MCPCVSLRVCVCVRVLTVVYNNNRVHSTRARNEGLTRMRFIYNQ
jgi:hypothetical protein